MNNRRSILSDELKEECFKLNNLFQMKKRSLGLTQRKIAEELNYSPSYVNSYLLGRKPLNLKIALYFSKILNVDIEDFSQRLADEVNFLASKKKLVKLKEEDEKVSAPFLEEVELAAGNGRISLQENINSTIEFDKNTLRNKGIYPKDIVCVKVVGNSMLPVLRNNAIVGVDRSKFQYKSIIDGEIYAVNHNGQLRVKQLFRTPKGIKIKSFNSEEHPDEEYSFDQIKTEPITIIGRIFFVEMYF